MKENLNFYSLKENNLLNVLRGEIAQMVRRLLRNPEVPGSNPVIGMPYAIVVYKIPTHTVRLTDYQQLTVSDYADSWKE